MTSVRREKTAPAGYHDLQVWYRQPLGRLLGDAEQGALQDVLPTLFGYHLVMVDPPWEEDACLETSRIQHRVCMMSTAGGGLRGSMEAAPLATDSVDTLILPHTLEFAATPHQVLREADRSLIPDGHLVVIGFNPRGVWGAGRLLLGWRGQLPWCLRFVSAARLKDWLALLGFDTLLVRPLFYRPPLGRYGAAARLGFLERLGARGWPLPTAAYLLLARKRVVTLTPIRPRWRPRRRFVAAGMPRPQSRETAS